LSLPLLGDIRLKHQVATFSRMLSTLLRDLRCDTAMDDAAAVMTAAARSKASSSVSPLSNVEACARRSPPDVQPDIASSGRLKISGQSGRRHYPSSATAKIRILPAPTQSQ